MRLCKPFGDWKAQTDALIVRCGHLVTGLAKFLKNAGQVGFRYTDAGIAYTEPDRIVVQFGFDRD